jgi:hypothetical protein
MTLNIKEILDYEVSSSWWASKLSSNWMQELAAWYFAKKVNRKYIRYLKSKDFEKFMASMRRDFCR